MTNPNYKNLAEFYGLTRQTVSKWEKSKPQLYKAMVRYFLEVEK